MLPLDDARPYLPLRDQDTLRLAALQGRHGLGLDLRRTLSGRSHFNPASARLTASANFGSTASAAGRMNGLAPIRRVPNSTNLP